MSDQLPRRRFLSGAIIAAVTAAVSPLSALAKPFKNRFQDHSGKMNPIKTIKPMGFVWETADPFLFCVHHEDHFPSGNENMGPDESHFKGRHLGDDFIIKDGFRMYHGKTVPGFPGHPHRGFETITVVRQGLVDHSDSMGASGRYGNGDVQWMTAGKGVQHAEMFPLIHADQENPMELFQIWLNLPKKNKMVEPHYKMFWKETIPQYKHTDAQGKTITIEIIAGTVENHKAPSPPPDSWASEATHGVAIWNIKMEAGSQWNIPKALPGMNRTIYIYEGNGVIVSGKPVSHYHAVELVSDIETLLEAGDQDVRVLLLQGQPIGEPVIQYGPFVMNTKEEINQAFEDYHQTQFGGWPWPKYDPVHPRNKSRFAKYADGTEEIKTS